MFAVLFSLNKRHTVQDIFLEDICCDVIDTNQKIHGHRIMLSAYMYIALLYNVYKRKLNLS